MITFIIIVTILIGLMIKSLVDNTKGLNSRTCTNCGGDSFRFDRELQILGGNSVSFKYKVCNDCGKRWRAGF